MVFRIEADKAEEELDVVWQREMVAGNYVPTWLKARTPQGRVQAIAFVINRGPNVCRRLSMEETAAQIAHAKGRLGLRRLSGKRGGGSGLAGIGDGPMHALLERCWPCKAGACAERGEPVMPEKVNRPMPNGGELSADQYKILRKKGPNAPWAGPYWTAAGDLCLRRVRHAIVRCGDEVRPAPAQPCAGRQEPLPRRKTATFSCADRGAVRGLRRPSWPRFSRRTASDGPEILHQRPRPEANEQ